MTRTEVAAAWLAWGLVLAVLWVDNLVRRRPKRKVIAPVPEPKRNVGVGMFHVHFPWYLRLLWRFFC